MFVIRNSIIILDKGSYFSKQFVGNPEENSFGAFLQFLFSCGHLFVSSRAENEVHWVVKYLGNLCVCDLCDVIYFPRWGIGYDDQWIIISQYHTLGILVRATQTNDQKYSYNTITVVLATELLKLFISIILYWSNHSIVHLCRDIAKDLLTLALYLVPALLYTLYNNLAFVNLANFDPTTYFLLLQFRVVITGVLFQVMKGQL